jgi:L-fuconolactonase
MTDWDQGLRRDGKRVKRREFLRSAGSAMLLQCAQQWVPKPLYAEHPAPDAHHERPSCKIIDAHIHLYDPTRPGGVPWPEKTDTVLYRPALPARFRGIAGPLGVVGAIAIECSPLARDNDWLLGTAASDSLIVGVIGDLDPVLDTFPKSLERLNANPLFRGIRYGNLWGRDLGERLRNPAFVENVKLLSQSGLLFETANPDPALIADLLTLTDRVPLLRVVIDHLPQAVPPNDPAAAKAYVANLQALSQRPTVFVKGSEVFRRVEGKVVHDPGFYRGWLDQLWEWFGEDRLFYGSDWPNSDHLASYAETLNLISRYVSAKGSAATAKFFWKNSRSIYRWKPRDRAQELLAI